MLYAHDLVQAHEAGQRARDRHGHDHRARGLDASVDRGRLVVAQRAQLVTPARVPEVEPDEAADRQRQEQREIDRRAADLPADRSSQVVELRHPRARRELARFRRLLAGLDQDVDEEMRHHRRGDEIEHDRGDHDVAAALGLQPRGHERPRGAAGRGHDDGGENDQYGRPAAGAEAQQRHAEAADVCLALGSDVEEATVERDGDGEASEDEVGRVVEGVADRLGVAERAAHQQAQRSRRTLADQEHHHRGQQQREREVDGRQQHRNDPAEPRAFRGRRCHPGIIAHAPR